MIGVDVAFDAPSLFRNLYMWALISLKTKVLLFYIHCVTERL